MSIFYVLAFSWSVLYQIQYNISKDQKKIGSISNGRKAGNVIVKIDNTK